MAGSSRFLNTIYATDLTVSGETSFAGITATGLTVNGAATVTGTLTLTKTTDLSGTANNSPALIIGGAATAAHIEIDANEIQGKATGTTTGEIFINNDGGKVNLSKSGKIYANDGTFRTQTLEVNGATYYFNSSGNINANGITATSATIGTANITTGKAADFEITGTLRTYEHDIDHVANLGGNFLVTPTINFLDGTVSITSLTKSGNVITATIKDASTLGNTAGVTSIGNVDWLKNAKIKIAGQIGGVVLGTCDGKLEADLNATAGTMTVSFTYTGNRLADIPTAGTAITDIKGLTVMLTETVATSGATTSHKIGIYMTARDSNNYSHISMYNGVSDDPTVRIGNLSGLDPVNGFDPDDLDDRWGIYTSNGFFKGIIISESGKIGGWFLGSDAIYSSSKTFAAANNMYFGASGISLGTTFKVTNAGALTSTSGNIAAFQIDATALHTANVAITSNADNSIALSHADFTRTVAGASRTGLRFAIGDKFGVTGDGVLYGSDVNLTGAINATSGTIGSNATYGNRWQIGDRAIYYGNATPGNSASTLVISTGTASTKSIGGSDTTSKNWMLAAGTGFGVTTAGVLYATGAHINGAITATSLTLSQGVTIGQDKIDGLTDDLSNALSKSGWYGTCSTTASQQIKDVTVSDDGFDLKPGTALTVYFTTANTVTNPKLRINNGESKSIIAWGNVTVASDTPLLWGSISHITFIYDGSYWMIENESRSYSATCSTAETTQTKAPSLNEVVITNGTTVTVHFSKANTYVAGPVKLNFAGTGAANIYVDDVVTSTTKTLLWDANTDLTFVRRGQYWYLVSRSDASKSATNYLTTITGTTGISVHDVGDTSNFVNMNSNGVFVYKGGIQRAQFGETTIIGKSYVSGASNNESHVEIDYRSLQLVDKENDVFFRARDFRDTNGIATMTDNFIGDGEKTSCTVRFDIESVIEVAINQTVTTAYTREGREFSFTTAPAEGSSVTIKYTTKSEVAKEYTLGLRSSNTTYGALSVAEGYYNTVSGHYSHGEGYRTMVTGDCSHAEGNTCYDENDDSILVYTTASGAGCHAEGSGTKASNTAAHSEGLGTVASGHSTHAEGYRTTASNSAAHSEGYKTIASGEGSHAEGIECIASANSTHAEGGETEASGNCSHAQNYKTKAIGIDSTAAGLGTLAKGAVETVIGMYNSPPENYDSNNRKWENPVFTIGNGSSDDERSNAFTVNWLGDVEMYMYVTIDPSTGKATSGTPTDLALRQAIEALGWVDDVIS